MQAGEGFQIICLHPRLERTGFHFSKRHIHKLREHIEELTRAVALRLAREEPGAFTANMAKAQRKGKVFVDYLRNVRGANAVGPYSTRAREGAPVAVPVHWDELDRLSGPTDFTVAEVPLRVLGFGADRAKDPWARYLECRQRVPESLTRDLLA